MVKVCNSQTFDFSKQDIIFTPIITTKMVSSHCVVRKNIYFHLFDHSCLFPTCVQHWKRIQLFSVIHFFNLFFFSFGESKALCKLQEALICIRASVGECMHISDSEQNPPFLTAISHSKTCVRNPVDHLWGHSTQTIQSCWSYDNLCQLIFWLDNLRSNIEFENRKLLHHRSRLFHNEESKFVIMVTEKNH